MRDEMKRLIELASVDLSFAELEVRFSDDPSDALNRIGHHLKELRGYVDELARFAEGSRAEVIACRKGA
jgi:hypothetical protein